jgi:hypothetical protein
VYLPLGPVTLLVLVELLITPVLHVLLPFMVFGSFQ